MTSLYPSKTRIEIETDLAFARQNNDFATEAACLIALGDIAKENEEYDLAQGLYGQAWAAYEKVGDIKGQALALKILGDVLAKQSEQALAELMYNNALSLYQAVNDQQGQAQTFYAKGEFYMQMYQHDVAQPDYRRALSLFHSVGNLKGEADAAYRLANSLWGQEYEQEVLSLLYQALDQYEALGDRAGQARVLESLSHYVDLDLASQYLERVIKIQEQLGNLQQQAIALLALSEVRIKQEDRQAALAHCEQALTISIDLKEREGAQNALNEIQWLTVGRNAPAPVAHLERCLTIYHQIHHVDGQIKTLVDMGENAIKAQDLSRARDFIQKASNLNNQCSGAEKLELIILEAFAELTTAEGNLAATFAYYKQQLPLVKAHRHEEYFAEFLEGIGYLLLDMGEIDQAMLYFQQACDAWQQTTERHRKAFLLERVSDIERKRKLYDKAQNALEQALDILKSYPPWLLSSVLWRLGVLAGEQNHNNAARNYFKQAWDIEKDRFRSLSPAAKQHVRSVERVEILWNWGRFEWSHGNQSLGCNYCRQALTLLAEQPDNRLPQYRIPYETWREEFDAMNCTPLPDTETPPHDD